MRFRIAIGRLRVLALLACVVGFGCHGGGDGSSETALPTASAQPFARRGGTRDLLCDLDRAARGDGAARCSCDDVPRTGGCGHVEVRHDRRRALLVDAGGKLSLPVESGDASFLRYAVGTPALPGQSLAIRVTATDATGEAVASHDDVVEGGAAWQDVSLALPKPVARVDVEVTTRTGTSGQAAVAMPRFVTPTSAAAGGPTNVIVYLIDTLRADHTSAYGYERDTTPRLAALARDGVRFERAYSTAARTRPATASLLTGLMPAYHGAHSGFALAPEVATLAERFHAGGWSTWAFVTNGHVAGKGLNFEQGFDRFLSVQSYDGTHARTGQVNEVLFPFLDALADEPFLLYVHALDPHAPYDPPAGYTGRFTDGAYTGPVKPAETVTADLEKLAIGDADLAHIVGLYDEEIYYQDAMFGELLDRLETLGVRDRTIIVVVADHGEEFRDHGAWAHGGRLFEEQIHVPLVFSVPGAAFAGRTVAQPVQILDVMPTLLEWFHLPGASACQGRDLTPLLTAAPGAAAPERTIYCEETTYLPGNEIKSLRSGDWKIIHKGAGSDLYETTELFDLQNDPHETRNVGRRQRRRLWELNDKMERLERSWARDFRARQGEAEHLDEQTRKQLRALGYVVD